MSQQITTINNLIEYRSLHEIAVEYNRIIVLEDARNRKIYGMDSLHAKGFLDPKCPLCSTKAALGFCLGLHPVTNGVRRRFTADISEQEIEDQKWLARKYEREIYEKIEPEEAEVNDW